MSTDRGLTWKLKGTPGTLMCSLAIRPDSAGILYAGSGHDSTGSSAGYSGGDSSSGGGSSSGGSSSSSGGGGSSGGGDGGKGGKGGKGR